MSNTAYPDGVAASGGSVSPSVGGTAPVFGGQGGRVNVDYSVSASEPGTAPRTFGGLDGALDYARSLFAHSALKHTRVVEVPTTVPLTVTIAEVVHVPTPKPPVHLPPPPPAR